MIRNDGKPSGYTTDHISAAVNSQLPTGTSLLDIKLLQSAPKSWNFFSSLSEFKKSTLKESILARGGIINPIIVWERHNDKEKYYMILSGHNRTESYKDIMDDASQKGYADLVDRFSKIPAIVKGEFDIDENEAQQIIIDSNWAQRELTPIEKQKSIIKKYTLVKENKNTFDLGDRNLRDKVAEDFNISGRQIQRYISLNTLTEEWQSILNEGDITLRIALKLTKFKLDRQQYLYDNHFDIITLGGVKVERALATIKDKSNNSSIDLLFENMIKEIDTIKIQNIENYSLKVSFDLKKEEAQILKELSKQDKAQLHKDIEDFIKSKYLAEKYHNPLQMA